MLPVAQFFSRRTRKNDEPRKDVLAEEYEWVFGRKATGPGDTPSLPRRDQRATNKSTTATATIRSTATIQ